MTTGSEKKRRQILEDYLWLKHESFRADPSRRQRPKKDEKSAQDKEPHLSMQELIRGNLARGVHEYRFVKEMKDGKATKKSASWGTEYYAWNGWNHLGTVARGDLRDVYRGAIVGWYHFYEREQKPNFYQLFPTESLGGFHPKGHTNSGAPFGPGAKHAYRSIRSLVDRLKSKPESQRTPSDEARLAYATICKRLIGISQNANSLAEKPTIGCELPYRWQAHHLLPMNCFYTYLEFWQLQVIMRSDYDINAGSNIIFLPSLEPDRVHHRLPHHRGSHPKYDLRLERGFQRLKTALDDLKQEGKHDALTSRAEQELHDMEDQSFEYLANLGMTSVNV